MRNKIIAIPAIRLPGDQYTIPSSAKNYAQEFVITPALRQTFVNKNNSEIKQMKRQNLFFRAIGMLSKSFSGKISNIRNVFYLI